MLLGFGKHRRLHQVRETMKSLFCRHQWSVSTLLACIHVWNTPE